MHKISLSKPHIEDKAINEVISVIKSGWLTQGKKVVEFEGSIKQRLGINHALAVNSATSGLHAGLHALGIKHGDEVIVPAFTWVATANAVELCGAKPIFVDIDPLSLNASTERIIDKISEKTKAIMVVHLFGKPFDVVGLKSKLRKGVSIIEDAACALGASINRVCCGIMGDIGVYSFHPRKSITTGEGGMIVTNCEDLFQQMSMFRNHGQDCSKVLTNAWDMFDCPEIGFNFRMTDFQAVLGCQQFIQLEQIIKYRSRLANYYSDKLSQCDLIVLPREAKNETHAWQSYVIQVPSAIRNKLMEQLSQVGVETRPGTHAVHMLSYYKNKYNLQPEDFPNTHQAFLSTISLPLHNYLGKEDIELVSDNILRVLNDIR
jgi:perosamine synthetase